MVPTRRTPAILLLAALVAAADDGPIERWDKPRRETFDLPGAWPEQVVEALSERFGIPVELDPADLKRADFVAKDVTLLEALDKFAVQHGLGLSGAPVEKEVENGPRMLRLVKGDRPLRAGTVCYLGPTRLSVQTVTATRLLACAAGQGVPLLPWGEEERPKLRVRLRWLAEPGLDGIILTDWQATTVEDDLGGRMKLAQAHRPPISANTDFILEFTPPSAGAKSIRKLEGSVRVTLPGERGKVEFLATEVGQAKNLGAARVTLDGIDARGRVLTLSMKGTPCPGIRGARQIDLRVGSDVALRASGRDANVLVVHPYDEAGHEIDSTGSGSSSGFFGRHSFNIDLEAVPTRIEIEALVRGVEHELPFSFADIPLPE